MDDSWLEDFNNLCLNTYEDEEESVRSLLTYPQFDCFLNDFSNHTTYQTVPIASSINEYLRIVKSNMNMLPSHVHVSQEIFLNQRIFLYQNYIIMP